MVSLCQQKDKLHLITRQQWQEEGSDRLMK